MLLHFQIDKKAVVMSVNKEIAHFQDDNRPF